MSGGDDPIHDAPDTGPAGAGPVAARLPSWRPGRGLGLPPLAFWRLMRGCSPWFYPAPRTYVEREAWPAGYDPLAAPVFAHNELFVMAPPDRVFAQLLRAEEWPEWYPNSWKLRLEHDALAPDGARILTPDSTFTWITFGVRLRSQIMIYEPDRALAWDAHGGGTLAHHRWLLRPAGPDTLVVTEECQVGIVPALIRPLMNRALHAAHELWLYQLAHQLGVATRPVEAPAPVP